MAATVVVFVQCTCYLLPKHDISFAICADISTRFGSVRSAASGLPRTQVQAARLCKAPHKHQCTRFAPQDTALAPAVQACSQSGDLGGVLQEFWPQALDLLLRASQKTRTFVLDRNLVRYQRRHSEKKGSRQWYAPADMWIAGTVMQAADDDAADGDAQEDAVRTCFLCSLPTSSLLPKRIVAGQCWWQRHVGSTMSLSGCLSINWP